MGTRAWQRFIASGLTGLVSLAVATSPTGPLMPMVRANGQFLKEFAPSSVPTSGALRSRESGNGLYRSTFALADNGKVHSLRFYAQERHTFSLPITEAHAVEVSNSGILLLVTIDWRTETPKRFSFYGLNGRLLFTRDIRNPEIARFSEAGNLFGMVTREHLEILDPVARVSRYYRPGVRFDVNADGSLVAVAYENGISVYRQGRLAWEATTGFQYVRGLALAPDGRSVAVADVRAVNLYAVDNGRVSLTDRLESGESIREIRFGAIGLYAGIKRESGDSRTGILKTYSLIGPSLSSVKEVHSTQPIGYSGFRITPAFPKAGALAGYPAIPWPFQPQNQAHMVWNNYEGFNSSDDGVVTGDYPYLHQGIDMEVNANTPVYSVDTGIVKYHGDLGGSGALYWRIAVSRTNVSGYSNGWLYAHLIDTTINYAVGDRISAVGLHLGNIVPWYGNVSGHLHFNEIRDHGSTWSYTDDEWAITYNPLYSLTPLPDTSRPAIVQALAGKSKFAYCPNNTPYTATATTYFFPDSARGGVRGNIDIIARLQDFIVYTNFTQPAHSIRFWIKSMSPRNPTYNTLILDTTLAQVRNHTYNFYSAASFKPASEVLYKADNAFVIGGWFNRTRTFAHVLTNNNGDSLLTPGEKDSSFHTNNYHNGWYRVYVKAFDIVGNAVLDSENVYFNNPNPVSLAGNAGVHPVVSGGYPETRIRFSLTAPSPVSLEVYDATGMRVRLVELDRMAAGNQSIAWDGRDDKGARVGRGLFFFRLRGDGFVAASKAVMR